MTALLFPYSFLARNLICWTTLSLLFSGNQNILGVMWAERFTGSFWCRGLRITICLENRHFGITKIRVRNEWIYRNQQSVSKQHTVLDTFLPVRSAMLNRYSPVIVPRYMTNWKSLIVQLPSVTSSVVRELRSYIERKLIFR